MANFYFLPILHIGFITPPWSILGISNIYSHFCLVVFWFHFSINSALLRSAVFFIFSIASLCVYVPPFNGHASLQEWDANASIVRWKQRLSTMRMLIFGWSKKQLKKQPQILILFSARKSILHLKMMKKHLRSFMVWCKRLSRLFWYIFTEKRSILPEFRIIIKSG